MDEDFICPMVWKWGDIYTALHAAWQERGDDAVPEPPHMLAANSTDGPRKTRWEETVAWAEQYVSSGLASIYNAVTPITTALFATLAFRVEKLTSGQVFGIAMEIFTGRSL